MSKTVISDIASSSTLARHSALWNFYEKVKGIREAKDLTNAEGASGKRELTEFQEGMRNLSRALSEIAQPIDFHNPSICYWERDFIKEDAFRFVISDDDGQLSFTKWLPSGKTTIPFEDVFLNGYVIISAFPAAFPMRLNLIEHPHERRGEIIVLHPDIFASLVPGIAEAATHLVNSGVVLFDQRSSTDFVSEGAKSDPTMIRFLGQTDIADHSLLYNGPVVSDEITPYVLAPYFEVFCRTFFENSILKFTGMSKAVSCDYVARVCNYLNDGHEEKVSPINLPKERETFHRPFFVSRDSMTKSQQKQVDAIISAMDVLRLWYVAASDAGIALLLEGDIIENESNELFKRLDSFKEKIGVESYEEAYWRKLPVDDLIMNKAKIDLDRNN